MFGTALGLVQGGEKRESSDSVTSDETTDHGLLPGEHGRGFDGETDHENDQTVKIEIRNCAKCDERKEYRVVSNSHSVR